MLDATLATLAAMIAALGVAHLGPRLQRLLDRRALHGGPAPARLRPPAHPFARLLRGDAHRRSLLARHQRRDADRSGDGRDTALRAAHGDHARGLHRHALRHQREAHRAGARGHAAGAGCRSRCSGWRVRRLVAGGAGSRGRRFQPRGRDAARDPHRAGLRARGRGKPTFGERVEAVFEVAIQRSGYLAMLVAAVIVLAFGSVGLLLWVGAHDVFAARLSRRSLTAFIFYAVLVANADLRPRRGLRRAATRRRRLGALARAARHDRRISSAPSSPARCRKPPAARRLRGRDLPLSVAPGRRRSSRFDPRGRARRGGRAGRPLRRGQDDRVPAAAALLRSRRRGAS